MEYPGSHAGRDGQGTSEPSWQSEVPVYEPALVLLRQAVAYAYPDELNRLADAVEEAADDDAGREQVVERLASWSLLPDELREQILYHLPDTDPCEIARVSRDMAAFAQEAYEQQRAAREQEEAAYWAAKAVRHKERVAAYKQKEAAKEQEWSAERERMREVWEQLNAERQQRRLHMNPVRQQDHADEQQEEKDFRREMEDENEWAGGMQEADRQED